VIRVIQTGIVSVAVVILLAACGGEPGTSFGPQDIAEVQQRALELAEQEIARFQAIDDKYRNDVNFYAMSGHPFYPEHGVYAKVYRDYADAEVAEVQLTNDLLKPISVDVAYNFSVQVTEGRNSRDADSPELAESDTEFSERWQGEIRKTYFFDFEKEPVGELPPAPDPPNYWTDTELTGYGGGGFQQ
jgi:hypothetical protein